ncbi:LOW QUALITY PROTEIN: hypothetical protein OSB04_010842 [Centaurea solstitialis]|uniref:Reverse transcriptase/retrotransposon-derived protein RNase H-like domain-containing protein n=1 Tax=Centaurea solstitialis TaxID=347529 RepID=A0AA38T8B8_9ASTR|nr:LOW QUALITY PROTEIN: hypothetical protein OSB04_010842 [Centaurea solstitialis]
MSSSVGLPKGGNILGETVDGIPVYLDPKLTLVSSSVCLSLLGEHEQHLPLKSRIRDKNQITTKLEMKDKEKEIRVKPMRYNPEDQKEFMIQTKELLDLKLIRIIPHSSPAFMVRKHSEIARGKARMVINYKKLNDNTVFDGYFLPRKESLINWTIDKKIFSKFDCKSGFWQIKMHPDSILYTSFSTPQGQYEWLVMPFGLKNAPQIFQGKWIKTKLIQEQIDFLGMKIDDKKQVQSFLGILNYASDFIKNLALLRKPFQDLLKKNKVFSFDKSLENQVKKIKEYCKILPKLQLPKDNDDLILETDASKNYWSGILKKIDYNSEQEKIGESICRYCSGTFTDTQTRYHINEKELLAVVKRYDFVLFTRFLDHSEIGIRATQISTEGDVERIYDCKSGFWQIKMHPDSILYTSFSTPQGQYEWLVMPFGLKNAPQIFQRKMDKSHLKHLDIFIELCIKNGLALSEKKTKLIQEQIDLLGMKIDGKGIELQSHILEKINSFPDKLIDKKTRILNYALDFIKNLALLRKPFQDLLKKNKVFSFDKSLENQNKKKLEKAFVDIVCNNRNTTVSDACVFWKKGKLISSSSFRRGFSLRKVEIPDLLTFSESEITFSESEIIFSESGNRHVRRGPREDSKNYSGKDRVARGKEKVKAFIKNNLPSKPEYKRLIRWQTLLKVSNITVGKGFKEGFKWVEHNYTRLSFIIQFLLSYSFLIAPSRYGFIDFKLSMEYIETSSLQNNPHDSASRLYFRLGFEYEIAVPENQNLMQHISNHV